MLWPAIPIDLNRPTIKAGQLESKSLLPELQC